MPDRLVRKVPQKVRWWMASGFVLVVALGLIVGVGVTLDQRETIARLEAARIADERAKKTSEDTAAVVSCLRGVYEVPNFLDALDGLAIVIDNQIVAAPSR